MSEVKGISPRRSSESSVCIVSIRPNSRIQPTLLIKDVIREVVLNPYFISFWMAPGLRWTAIEAMEENDTVKCPSAKPVFSDGSSMDTVT
jgi:hypothetical protein